MANATASQQQTAHVCLDKTVAQIDVLKAAELAIEENPDNAPSGSVDMAYKPGATKNYEMFGAVLTGKKWKPGRTLKVRHLDGDPAIHAKVERFAKEWEKYANIKFQFVTNGPADVRISYHLDYRSWSYIGTDALTISGDKETISGDKETMHYGWLTPDTDDTEVGRVVVHEFGHAIGMIHEQSQPMNTIKWDKAAVYRHYAQQGWSKEQVDFNVFEQYNKEVTQFSKYDPTSIMHYPVPKEFTTDGKAVGWNTELSTMDKLFIAEIYPKPAPAGAPPAAAPPMAAARAGRLTHTW
jgi:serralysin